VIYTVFNLPFVHLSSSSAVHKAISILCAAAADQLQTCLRASNNQPHQLITENLQNFKILPENDLNQV